MHRSRTRIDSGSADSYYNIIAASAIYARRAHTRVTHTVRTSPAEAFKLPAVVRQKQYNILYANAAGRPRPAKTTEALKSNFCKSFSPYSILRPPRRLLSAAYCITQHVMYYRVYGTTRKLENTDANSARYLQPPFSAFYRRKYNGIRSHGKQQYA